MATTMDNKKTEPGRWSSTVVPKKGNFTRSHTCKYNSVTRKIAKTPCPNVRTSQPKCFIKISGSRYNGTFLLNINEDLDNAIYNTMREIEVALDEQLDPLSKPRVSPKNCLSSVFRCFGANDMTGKAECVKKKCTKPSNKSAECSLRATINQSELGHILSSVQLKSPSGTPEKNKDIMMREVVDVFRTTLDQICLSDMTNFEVAQSMPNRSSTTGANALNNISEGEDQYQPSHPSKELRKVSFIKFSQEEMLVIQPPKPSNNDSHLLEVGIEVKPKITTAKVEQSIKLAKDRVSIGIQDGAGVLQIREGAPKRTLQMVIEEGGDGKPSMKLSLNEGGQGQEVHSNRGPAIMKDNFQNNNSIDDDVEHDEANDEIKNPNRRTCLTDHYKAKWFKSVQSQVSWPSFKQFSIIKYDNQMHEPKCKSTQYDSNDTYSLLENTEENQFPIIENNTSDSSYISHDTVSESVPYKKDFETAHCPSSKLKRKPYFVQSHHDAHSLDSGSYFVNNADKSSSCNISTITVPLPKRIEISRNHTKKLKNSSALPDGSAELTNIFRDIEEDNSIPMMKKRHSKSTKEDFEQILKNMCGPSYLYHESKPIKIAERCDKEQVQKHYFSNMLFDQWAQTENDSATCEIRSMKNNNQTANEKKVGPDEPMQLGFTHYHRAINETVSSESDDESSMFSDPEDGISFQSTTSNLDKVSAVIKASSNKRLKTKCRLFPKTAIRAKAKSFVGQQIFAALEERTSIPGVDGLLSKSNMCEIQASKKQCLYPFRPDNNVTLVNLAICDNPSIHQQSLNIEHKSENNNRTTHHCIPNTAPEHAKASNIHCSSNWVAEYKSSCKPFVPPRIKSRSCQNLVVELNRSQLTDITENPKALSKTKRLRFPHSTISGCSQFPLSVCGILNFNHGKVKAPSNRVIGTNGDNSAFNYDLSQAIQALLLPEDKPGLFTHRPTSASCGSQFENFNVAGVWSLDNVGPLDSWSDYQPSTYVSFRKNVIQRTFLAMKTAVSKRFRNIVRKLSSIDIIKKKRNITKNDSSAYIAVPLTKKRENMHLCRKKY